MYASPVCSSAHNVVVPALQALSSKGLSHRRLQQDQPRCARQGGHVPFGVQGPIAPGAVGR